MRADERALNYYIALGPRSGTNPFAAVAAAAAAATAAAATVASPVTATAINRQAALAPPPPPPAIASPLSVSSQQQSTNDDEPIGADVDLDDILGDSASHPAATAATAATAAAATTNPKVARNTANPFKLATQPLPRQQPLRRVLKAPFNRMPSASAVPAIPFDAKDCPAATIGNGVEVKPSKLGRKAGLGLFATRRFETGAIVTEYDGCVIDEREAKARQEQKISTHIRSLGPKHAFIDGRDVPNERWRGGASFANDSFGTPAYNAKLEQHRPDKYTVGVNRSGVNVLERVFLHAIKDIESGDEIYVNYGKDYWDLYPKSK